MSKLLTERVSFDHFRVGGTDAAPVVEGVLLCGALSANRRRYLKQAFEGDRVKRYNGKPVFADHGSGTRSYLVQIGTIENARHRSDGMPIGDIAVNPQKEAGRAFVWDAKHQPRACAMSHVAHCETRRAGDGFDEVTEVVQVESVDVISANGAATAKALNEDKKVSLTVKALCEALVKHPKVPSQKVEPLKVLAEMDGMGDMPTAVDAAPADDADPEQAITDAFRSAMHAQIDALISGAHTRKEMGSKLMELAKSLDKLTGKKAEPDDTPADDAPKESKLVKAADVLAECAAAKFDPTYQQGEHLRAIPDKDTRAVVIESFKGSAAINTAETPRSTGRKPPVKEDGQGTEERVACLTEGALGWKID